MTFRVDTQAVFVLGVEYHSTLILDIPFDQILTHSQSHHSYHYSYYSIITHSSSISQQYYLVESPIPITHTESIYSPTMAPTPPLIPEINFEALHYIPKRAVIDALRINPTQRYALFLSSIDDF